MLAAGALVQPRRVPEGPAGALGSPLLGSGWGSCAQTSRLMAPEPRDWGPRVSFLGHHRSPCSLGCTPTVSVSNIAFSSSGLYVEMWARTCRALTQHIGDLQFLRFRGQRWCWCQLLALVAQTHQCPGGGGAHLSICLPLCCQATTSSQTGWQEHVCRAVCTHHTALDTCPLSTFFAQTGRGHRSAGPRQLNPLSTCEVLAGGEEGADTVQSSLLAPCQSPLWGGHGSRGGLAVRGLRARPCAPAHPPATPQHTCRARGLLSDTTACWPRAGSVTLIVGEQTRNRRVPFSKLPGSLPVAVCPA